MSTATVTAGLPEFIGRLSKKQKRLIRQQQQADQEAAAQAEAVQGEAAEAETSPVETDEFQDELPDAPATPDLGVTFEEKKVKKTKKAKKAKVVEPIEPVVETVVEPVVEPVKRRRKSTAEKTAEKVTETVTAKVVEAHAAVSAEVAKRIDVISWGLVLLVPVLLTLAFLNGAVNLAAVALGWGAMLLAGFQIRRLIKAIGDKFSTAQKAVRLTVLAAVGVALMFSWGPVWMFLVSGLLVLLLAGHAFDE